MPGKLKINVFDMTLESMLWVREVRILRKMSHLIVELRALIVVQDSCIGAAGKE